MKTRIVVWIIGILALVFIAVVGLMVAIGIALGFGRVLKDWKNDIK